MIRIEIKALLGLHNLKELDLYNNSLELEDSFPMSVFVPISQSLEYLDIRRNLLGDISQMYYLVSVGELIGLKELRIDCVAISVRNDIFSRIELNPSFVLSSDNTNDKIDIQ